METGYELIREECLGIVEWSYRRLRVAATIGTAKYPLERSTIPSMSENLEIAPLRQLEGKKSLAAFSFNPAIDITISQARDGSLAAVLYSLEKNKTRKLAELIRDKIMSKTLSSGDFVRSIEPLIFMETFNYDVLHSVAKRTGSNFDALFMAPRYTNFLSSYVGVDIGGAQKMAVERFGIKLPMGNV